MKKKILAFLTLIISGCVSIPENVQAVNEFELNKYLGTWYEIARLDHSFERGLEKVTADYSLKDDGGVKVLNKGYDVVNNKWKSAEGKAYFVGSNTVGRLKVSFFGPFYAGYNIIDLDKKNYLYAMICSSNKSYLWILCRKQNMDDSVKTRLVNKAKNLGFETDKLIFVKQ